MSKMLLALSIVAAATGTLATRVIWTVVADPTTMAAALGSGSVQVILSALLGAH
jgi:hypothetical protein